MIILNPENHEYRVDNVVKISVTQLLEENGLSDFSMVNPEVLRRAMNFGKVAHYACGLFDKGMFIELEKLYKYIPENKSLIPFVNAWSKYIEEKKVEIIEIEKPYYSKVWDYCGQPDRIVKENGVLVLPDIKTVATLQKAVGLQLTGYKMLWEENNKQKIKKIVAVQLLDNGDYKRVVYKPNENVFKSMLTVRGWKKNNNYI